MTRTVDVHIGAWHGKDCTCHQLEPITFRPVIVHDDCPGTTARPAPRHAEPIGRIAITWLAPQFKGMALPAWTIQLYDLDSDRPILTATGLRIVIGGDGWDSGGIYADLTLLVDDEGQPIPNDGKLAIGEDERVQTAVFRYAVCEMRTAEPKQ